MISYTELKKHWDEYRIAKQYISQGEILEEVAANKRMTCPRCKNELRWVEDKLYFKCISPKCTHKEGVSRDVDNKPHFLPPNGSDYWVVTVHPPKWFFYEFR